MVKYSDWVVDGSSGLSFDTFVNSGSYNIKVDNIWYYLIVFGDTEHARVIQLKWDMIGDGAFQTRKLYGGTWSSWA